MAKVDGRVIEYKVRSAEGFKSTVDDKARFTLGFKSDIEDYIRS